MQKEPTFTLRLSELDKVLMGSNPYFRIIPLRITMEFKTNVIDSDERYVIVRIEKI